MFSDFPCYRDYVIVVLSQLTCLDGREITRTERLKAQQKIEENRREIIQLQVSNVAVCCVCAQRDVTGWVEKTENTLN